MYSLCKTTVKKINESYQKTAKAEIFELQLPSNHEMIELFA